MITAEPTTRPLYPWCATCGARLVLDTDGWLVHAWQADYKVFTDEQYPIIWKESS